MSIRLKICCRYPVYEQIKPNFVVGKKHITMSVINTQGIISVIINNELTNGFNEHAIRTTSCMWIFKG